MKSTDEAQEVPAEATTRATFTIPEGMNTNVIYTASEHNAKGYHITTLCINRPLNSMALKLKRKSISDCLGVITPSLVALATDCLKDGLEVNMPDGVTDPAKVLVILDGGHRQASLDQLKKSGKGSFENYYHLPINGNISISKTLRSINLVVRPWKGVDILTSILLEKADSGVDLSRLLWFQSLCGSMSEKVAWQWASLSSNRPPIKSKIDKAATNDEVLKEIAGVSEQADIDRFSAGKAIFEELNNTLTKEELGWAEIPNFFIRKYTSIISGKMDSNEAKELLVEFCKTVTNDVVEPIRGHKSVKDRTESINRVFMAQYNEFENNRA